MSSFWTRVRFQPAFGCWEWIGKRNTQGYGQHNINGKYPMAHRFVYETLMGPVPEGLQLDHLCRVRHCVNPLHLEPVTPKENVRRSRVGEVTAKRCREQTHCKRGHEFTPENTRMYTKGTYPLRRCRACDRWRYEQLKQRRAGAVA